MKLIHLFKNLFLLFYPKLCIGCLKALLDNEHFLCSECFRNLPETNYHLNSKNNRAYDRFAGKILIQKASSYLYYNQGGVGQKLVADIKYNGNVHAGKWIGYYMAETMLTSDFFEDIDFIVPVPLHKKKLRKRGFNQCEILAKAISDITNIPMETKNLYRTKANITQTKKGVYERWKNTQGIFQIKDITLFNNKHILLLDDVLTTGATLESCAHALLKCENIKISILTLAIA